MPFGKRVVVDNTEVICDATLAILRNTASPHQKTFSNRAIDIDMLKT